MNWFAEVPTLGDRPLGGLVPGAAAYALSRLRSAWIVVATPEAAEIWLRALRYHGAAALPYPADDGRPWDGLSPDPELPRRRIATLDAWERAARGELPPFLVVAPAAAVLLRVPARPAARVVEAGAELDRRALTGWLREHGYVGAQRAVEPGCFVVRGGILDVWVPSEPLPARIEWFDDTIDTIRTFNPDGEARDRRKLPRLRILPAREAPLSEESAERAAAYLQAVGTERGVVGADRRRILADLRAGIWFAGAEDYLPALIELATLRPGPPLYVVEPEAVREELARVEARVRSRFDAADLEDRPLVRPFDRWLTAEQAPLGGAVAVRALAGETDFHTRDNRALRVGTGDLAPAARQLQKWAAEGRSVTLVADSAHRADRLRSLFEPYGLQLAPGKGAPERIGLDIGDLPVGFTAEDVVFVAADELFAERREAPAPENIGQASRAFRRAAVADFSTLKNGDLVVHTRHGIGRYEGLARMPLGEGAGDFVLVSYRDGERLYVPVHRLDLVTPYRAAGEGEVARLDRLGGVTWEARRAKVRDAVLALAHELLQLHARRKLARARPYDGSNGLYDQFAETFPHVETPDQEVVIDEVLADLGSEDPMDRLLVGDVGFGKTEVAMRAAFRVVEGGGQVALLCPTTILAFQHNKSFRDRLEGFPVRVEVLSRFRSGPEIQSILRDTAAGKVDILIGTTKLLGRAVKFRELGLVVVDEEHRFGVRQKEQLKRMAANCHYLAMTATPIPRTLQLALSGVRSLSILSTPPEGRHAIRTEIVRFSRDRVREDVLHELRRGGQVYFVHNRVQSIEGVGTWLRQLVPEASVVVAHGQMEDEALERVLVRFVEREADVLVSTTIIESGIDLPDVNTMIVNRADTFGLAQLYQLRGRIGRAATRAVCTLLVGGTGEPRKEAMARLRTLQEHSELGSNFALASADLELRGGGELLGQRQHGHIAAIGFDAYLELLEEAVGRARGEAKHETVDPEIEVSAPAWIPEDYLPDLGERLDAYQQLARARKRDEVQRVLARLEQRAGEPPPEVINLGWLATATVRARDLGLARVAMLKVRVLAEPAPGSRVTSALVARLCEREPSRFRRHGDTGVEMRFTPEEAQHPFRVVEFLLARLEDPLPAKKDRTGA